MNGAKADRAAVAVHDIGLHAAQGRESGERWRFPRLLGPAEAWAGTPRRSGNRHPRIFLPPWAAHFS